MFNINSWNKIEQFIEKEIRTNVPEEDVYIMTGVFGSALDNNGKEIWLKNRVKVPGYYWKAVCYPGNKIWNTRPWGFAYVRKNTNEKVKPDFENTITLKKFADKYFKDPPFGRDCMQATYKN